MSEFVLHKGHRPRDAFARDYGADVATVILDSTWPTKAVLSDGREGIGTCLGCGQAPCMLKDPSELSLGGALEDYPGDPSLEVCPTAAITWDAERSVAIVNSDSCVGCGLCVVRCPYGAISLKSNTSVEIECTDPDGLVTTGLVDREHATPDKVGVVTRLDGPAAKRIPITAGSLSTDKAALLIRNVLHELGVNARVRRRGDTNMRIDAVGLSRSGRPFVAEIELSLAVLESPRALLEDVAILHSRYGYAVADIDAVSVILSFPNVRSEYYQVIRDIANVLDIHCNTVTLGLLLALMWSRSSLEGFGHDALRIGPDRIDLSGVLPLPSDRLLEPYPGAFTPTK